MNFLKKAIIFVIAPLLLSFSAKADIKVVTTIKPLHSLISSVMESVGEPSLIIEEQVTLTLLFLSLLMLKC